MGALFSLDHVGIQVVAMAATFILCLTLGAERHLRHKDAGVKTHVLVGLGSCLFTLVSAYGFAPITGSDVSVDPSRVAAQIVSGIGFLGAGVIFVNNDTVRGLTTAATVWLSAAIGVACAARMLPAAALALGLHYLLVFAVAPLTAHLPQQGVHQAVEVTYEVGHAVMPALVSTATSLGYATSISSTSSQRSDRGRVMSARMSFQGGKDAEALVRALAEVEGVISVDAVHASGLD